MYRWVNSMITDDINEIQEPIMIHFPHPAAAAHFWSYRVFRLQFVIFPNPRKTCTVN
jgi:hypothetical protein